MQISNTRNNYVHRLRPYGMGWIRAHHFNLAVVKVLGWLTNHKIPTCHRLVKARFRVEDQDHNINKGQ